MLDRKTGSTSEYIKEISPAAKVEEIAKLLPDTDPTFCFYFNRCVSVDDQELISEAFSSEDTVTVWVGAPPASTETKRKKVKTNIQNNSDHEIVVVAWTKEGWPIFFKGKQLKAVKFDFLFWSKKIVLYR